MVEYIASGFWQAFSAMTIVCGIASLIGRALKKKNRILGEIVIYVPAIIIYLYIWQIRHGVGWLIFGIGSFVWLLLAIAFIPLFVKMPLKDEMLADEIAGMFMRIKFPVMVDAVTRLDSISALSGKKILYNYTILNMDAGQTFPSDKIPAMRGKLLKDVKDNASLARYRKHDVIFIHRYMDKEQQGQVGLFEITPADYRKI